MKCRMLHTITKRDLNETLCLYECIDFLGAVTFFFSALQDCSSRYWPNKIDDADKDKIGFTLHHGLYRTSAMQRKQQNDFDIF